ncbi:MAG: endonuclease [Pirellulaceae bacterium]|nr:endonuclease [Pirellulaceae bacterium]
MSMVWFVALATLAGTTHAQGWKQTREFEAAEAIQAAAIDAQFVYAINNTQVAKYDRSSGQRLALSSGEAKHLNSGFAWEGKLYCAHSNYPLMPEKSEIKVLDVQSMELTTYKDFGDYGGSLTWCVREDDVWWCHFAKYAELNSKSFLVKFDSDWKEINRWTLPPGLIAQLGQYSLSGGLWHDGMLLATGHDDPIVFHLRLPKSGQVLELVGTEPAPITGQGFAIDRQSNELVGINRAKRLVVFAKR